MKQVLITILFVLFLIGGTQAQTKSKPNGLGAAFNTKNAIPTAELPRLLGSQDSVAVKVSGQVQQVCQVKGCWMDVKLADNSVMKVRFKNYGFFVPKDLAGKTVTINGMAYNKTVSVAEQQHYAQDAGKSNAEVKAITQPQRNVTFVASGVVIQ
ncbi:MAG: DUF4920 domain-containing protein [Cytophagales bacterium CG18_big_fil_WC_8_21_14_2_50_42_9]|nr:MAG: DUF4920 domain-containing protein [Cytophagales bacterium CG18_big_fil_WC_8_21_14_2_50_42_9]